ncbi:disease resistance protein RGA5-like [Hordeum vulgare subsp. vulgare]|uniref:disease resistance protein RGA5-like n=1 Tax=Hordeum vulgare subsp. vulgare TaxID=112509 RepID=UPI001B8495CD|nr:disease resistance protein RGA5-like [Hordeum vulgare subsp. vulgare]
MNLVTGAMGSLLPKLGELLKEEYKLQKGVKKDVASLSNEMRSMHAALHKVAGVPLEQLDEQVRLWASDVKDLSYHMEDVVDRFLVRVEGFEVAPDSDGLKLLVNKMATLFTKGKTRRRIADAIKDIKEQMQDVTARRDRYRVDGLVVNVAATRTLDPRLSALYNKVTDLVGIDEPRDELIKRLTDEKTPTDVVSIAGFGGLGKTTLAKTVYDSLKSQFHCAAFVSLSQNPVITRVLKKMLHQLDQQKYAHINEASWDETQLIDELRMFLSNKRYLIVIDDIWKMESWQIIKCALNENRFASRIITTTRDFDIATKVGGSFKLDALTLESSQVLFYGRIFGSKGNCPEQLAKVSLRILKKCGGVPLAIITMASLLDQPSKRVNPREWHEVCESIGSGLVNSPDVENMRKILALSYYNLPCHLRTCLLYLSIYPEDHDIHRDDLIWKWITEGFIQHKIKDSSLFDVGHSYFSELVNKGMIQPCIDFKGNATRCRLHDMVLELICSLSSQENFVTILDRDEDIMSSQRKIRRLSLQSKREDHQTSSLASMGISQVRSITIFEPAKNLMPTLSRFDVLRVLDLSGCHVGESNQNTLRDVGNLVHLRYLGLAGADICELPTEIGRLRFLQVLDVRNNPDLEELPWTIYGLRRLICLHVDGYRTRLPAGGLGNLTSLEVLRRVPASLTIMKELRNLESLRELKIKFEHNVSSELEEAFVDCLSKLHKIQSVVIRGCFPSIDLLGEGWVPPRHLRTFDLFMLGKFSKIPAWIEREPSILWNLSELIIGLKEVQPEDLRVLGSLPALRILALHSAQQAQRLLAIGADAGFHCLVAFSLYCESPRQIMFQQGALPVAEAVLFNFGVQKAIEDGNGGYFFGLGNLPSIRRLYVGIDRDGATVAEVKEAVTKLQRAVGAHPNHPSIAADIRPPIQPVDEDEVKTSNEVTPSKGQDEEKTWEPKKFQERFQNFRAKTTSDSNSEI